MKLYGVELERVRKFKFLGLWLAGRVTWGAHIQELVGKCKSFKYFEVFSLEGLGSE